MTADEIRTLLLDTGINLVGDPVKITGGWSDTELWRVPLDRGERLLRIFPVGRSASVMREHLVLDHADTAGLPAPSVELTGCLGQRPFLLIDWLDGHDLVHELLNRPAGAWSFGREMGELQAKMHKIDAPPGLRHASNWPDEAAIPERLRAILRSDAATDRLLHLDFHPGNIIVTGDTMSGILDWTNASAGDPRFDVARTFLLLRLAPGLSEAVYRQVRPMVRKLLAGWRSGYVGDAGSLRGMAPFLAWAGHGMIFDLASKPETELPGDVLARLRMTIDMLTTWTSRWSSYAYATDARKANGRPGGNVDGP